jgi:hypothetical protein
MTLLRPTIQNFINQTYVPELECLENSLFELFSRLDIDNATGKTLENISKTVGANFYNSENVDLTRIIIKGTITANNSRGTIKDIDNAFKLITGSSDSYVTIHFPKSIVLWSAVDFDDTISAVILEKMKKAVPGDSAIITLQFFSDDTCRYDRDFYDEKYYSETLAE